MADEIDARLEQMERMLAENPPPVASVPSSPPKGQLHFGEGRLKVYDGKQWIDIHDKVASYALTYDDEIEITTMGDATRTIIPQNTAYLIAMKDGTIYRFPADC